MSGAGHTLRNIHIYHNWNASGCQNATGLVVENIRAHGAPNHCRSGRQHHREKRDALNCQDYVWLNSTDDFTFEHLTAPWHCALRDTAPVGTIIVRNSIFSGSFGYIRGPVLHMGEGQHPGEQCHLDCRHD